MSYILVLRYFLIRLGHHGTADVLERWLSLCTAKIRQNGCSAQTAATAVASVRTMMKQPLT